MDMKEAYQKTVSEIRQVKCRDRQAQGKCRYS
jgi:hypothetical protein